MRAKTKGTEIMSGKQTAYMNGYDYMRIKGHSQDDLEMFLQEAKLSKQQYKSAKCQDDFVRGLEDMYHTILEERAAKEADQLDEENEKALQDLAAKDAYVDTYRIKYRCANTVYTLSFNATSFNEARSLFHTVHPHSTIITIECLLKTSYAAHKETRTPTIDFTGVPLHSVDQNDLVICDITFTDAKGTSINTQRQYMTYTFAMEYALIEAKHDYPSCKHISIHLSHRSSLNTEDDTNMTEEPLEKPIPALSCEPQMYTFVVTYEKGGREHRQAIIAYTCHEALHLFNKIDSWDHITGIERKTLYPSANPYVPAKVILLNFHYLPNLIDALNAKPVSMGQLKELEQQGYKFQSYHGHFNWTYEELLRLTQGEYEENVDD